METTSFTTQSCVVKEDPFPELNPYKYVEIKHFVAMCMIYEGVLAGFPFFFEKVVRFHWKRKEQGDM